MVLESTVSIAKTGTKSVRATVPEGIVSYLEIEVGDKLEWRMDNKNSERVTIVSKKRFKTPKSLEESWDTGVKKEKYQ
jgi:hypothetical protein